MRLEYTVLDSKKWLLSRFEDMFTHNDGKEVILLLNSNIGEVTKTAASINYDDGYILAKVAGILHRLVILLIFYFAWAILNSTVEG